MCNFKLITFYLFLLTPEILSALSGIRKCTSSGLVALTFDDGPSLNGETEKLLKVLREKGVKATFFITGNYPIGDKRSLDDNTSMKRILRQIFKDGHQIGSHSWNHKRLTELTTKEIRADISRLEKTVQDILGINMTVIRAPYSASDESIRKFLKDEFNYELVLWNLDPQDWLYHYYNSSIMEGLHEYELQMSTPVKANETSFITVHHDPIPGSGELAKKTIEFVQSKGYKLVTVGQCIGVPDYVWV